MTTTATNYKPIVLCSTAKMSEEEWLGWRTTGIGGSDAGTVLGVNPYKTKRELFYEKTGVKPVKAKDNNALPLRWGHALEETVAEEFSIQTGLRVYEVKEMYQHPLYPFMLANVDRFIDLPDGSVGILECKTANPNSKSKWEDGGVPFHYECQVRHYMAVMNINVAYIACLFENSSDTMAIRRIERDPVFEEELITAEKDFWENYVLKNDPPAFTEKPELCFETIDRYVQAQISKKAMTLTGFDEVLPTIAELKEKKKALEDAAKAVQDQIDTLILPIIDSMGTQTASTANVNGIQYNISYKPMDRTSINKDNLKRLQIGQFFRNRFSIITGGPGTGKSTVLKAILETQFRIKAKSDVLLLAPTGKAARRMADATGKEACTIHSGLHISEETKLEDIGTVDADVVIVDEVSMCDQKLFAILMAAVDPKKSKLLLVGDSDQLPSVGAGNVLNELITCGKVPVTRLDLVYRQGAGSIIPKNAESINNGNSKLSYNQEFQFIRADEPDFCFDTVVAQYIFEIKNNGIENCCILCPMKSRGKNCVNEYNKCIQATINPPAPNKPEITLKSKVFRIGDRVMQTKNSENVSNGETGFIAEIKKDEDDNQLCGILFDAKADVLWYYPEEMQNITLAYSITIHKSQGSEYKSVIIPMLKSYYIMLKRNLLYTAVTRAKSKVIIVGQRQEIFMAVNKTETDKRNTQLGRRIRDVSNCNMDF